MALEQGDLNLQRLFPPINGPSAREATQHVRLAFLTPTTTATCSGHCLLRLSGPATTILTAPTPDRHLTMLVVQGIPMWGALAS